VAGIEPATAGKYQRCISALPKSGPPRDDSSPRCFQLTARHSPKGESTLRTVTGLDLRSESPGTAFQLDDDLEILLLTDVVRTLDAPLAAANAEAAPLLHLQHAAGVVEHSEPFPVTWTSLQKGHTTGGAEVEGRNSAFSSVDQPKLTQGTWVRPGGVVVEAAFANALGFHVGDRLNLGGTAFRVVGTAVTAAIPAYPGVCGRPLGCFLVGSVSSSNPGLVWATEADAEHIAGTSGPVAYVLSLKLNDPVGASVFADRYDANASPTAPTLFSWQSIRDGDAQVIAKVQKVLLTGSWLLALLAVASVTVLVGGRMAEQTRRVGLPKAVGGTQRFVAVVLLFEHVLVGLCAAGIGLLVGQLVAPLIDSPGAGLLGAPSAPSLSGTTVGLVVAVALAVAIVATFVPAIRAARQSTVAALEDSARPPRRSTAVISLPAPLLLGGPASRAPTTATAPQRVQRRRHHERSRRRADRPCKVSGLVSRCPGGPGDHHHLSHAHRPCRRQRRLHRLDDSARSTAPRRARPCARSHARANHHRPVRGLSAAGSPRSVARHPGRDRHLRRRQEWRRGHDASPLRCGLW